MRPDEDDRGYSGGEDGATLVRVGDPALLLDLLIFLRDQGFAALE